MIQLLIHRYTCRFELFLENPKLKLNLKNMCGENIFKKGKDPLCIDYLDSIGTTSIERRLVILSSFGFLT